MRAYKSQFLDLAIELDVLRFGEFELKSGRTSPYFFDAGRFDTGYAAARLGRCYSSAIVEMDIQFDMIFGPAYKAITLAALTAAALAEHYDRDYPYAFNRKEAKDHGEGGSIVGAALTGRVLILDDVITAGTAIRESMQIIQSAGAQVAGVLVALDREEFGTQERISAVSQVTRDLDVPVYSIVTLSDLVDHLESREDLEAALPAIRAYRNRYGTHFAE